MLTFKDKIEKTISYKNTDFFKADSIGVIARGPSLNRLDLCYNKFNHCFLAGEFNNSLNIIDKYLLGKSIVLFTMRERRYRTSIKNCKRLNIKNIQVKFEQGSDDYRDCVKRFSDLKVSGCNKKHSKIAGKINKEYGILSTGIAGIFYSLYFNPVNIYIIGIDFYNENRDLYFIREEHDKKTPKNIRGIMVKNLNGIVRNFPETNFHLYTTYEDIKSYGNLDVIYV